MRLACFFILLLVIVLAAHAAGARFGPVTTTHSHVLYTGGSSGATGTTGGTGNTGGTMNGMNMSGTP